MNLQTKLKFNDVLFNKISADQLFSKIKTWREFYLALGMVECDLYYTKEQLDKRLTGADVKDQREHYKLRIKMEERKVVYTNANGHYDVDFDLWCLNGTPIPVITALPPEMLEVEITGFDIQTGKVISNFVKPPINFEPDDADLDKKPLPILFRPPSTHLFWFQNKAVRQIQRGILIHKRRAQLLEAGTGSGKTFVAGGLIEQLWDPKLDFFSKCLSPWPCVYITRASIVEQTSRVLRQQFGLDAPFKVSVINVEQLRSKYGRMMVEESTKVVQGKPEIHWKWKPMIHPKLFIIDESHLAKNGDSTQSAIVQSLADIEDEIYIVFMSATPFMRVSEAKYFCINTQIEF